jgi:peptidoglycan/LPS O-acetylase OafA/YrhL
MDRIMPFVMLLLALSTLFNMRHPFWLLIILHLLTFFTVAMICHGRLATSRPPTYYLTEFYLWISVGGVLGGVFNALLAPAIFETSVEYPLMVVLGCLFGNLQILLSGEL